MHYSTELPDHVAKAIKCGPIPTIRPIDEMVADPITDGEKVIAFAHRHLIVPEGPKVGEPLRLDIYQIAFILAVFGDEDIGRAYLSIARRNGKTLVIAVILMAYICGPLASLNTTICSAANSKEQASATFELLVKMIDLSPDLEGRVKYVLSAKRITGLKKNVQYRAISAEAKTGHGKAYKIILLDEAGQIEAESNAFTEMLESSQQNYDDSIIFIISTQAPSDASFFSIQLDSAEVTQDPSVVSHVYTIPEKVSLTDEMWWIYANPGIGQFLSYKKLRQQARNARDLPSKSNGIKNLHFNQRVSLAKMLLSAESWKGAQGKLNTKTRKTEPIDIGLDLSVRTDLTAAVASWRDPDSGPINVETHAFAPQNGVEARATRDKAPYERWAREGFLKLTPGSVISYEWVCEYLALAFAGCTIRSIQFDRYRVDLFKEAAKKTDLYAMVGEWVAVGQGFVSMGVRVDAFEQEVINGNLRTGSHPVMNMAASNTVVAEDPARNRKPMKNKSTQRIDPIVAGLMSVYPNSDGDTESDDDDFDPSAMIG